MSVFGEIRPSSAVVTSLSNAPGCPGRRHGGSVLNGGNKGGAPLGANVARRCSRDSPSDLPFKKPSLSGPRTAAHMLRPHATIRALINRKLSITCSFFWAQLGLHHIVRSKWPPGFACNDARGRDFLIRTLSFDSANILLFATPKEKSCCRCGRKRYPKTRRAAHR